MKTIQTCWMICVLLIIPFANRAQVVGPPTVCEGEPSMYEFIGELPEGAALFWNAPLGSIQTLNDDFAIATFNNDGNTFIEASIIQEGEVISTYSLDVEVLPPPIADPMFSGSFCYLFSSRFSKYEPAGISSCVNETLTVNLGDWNSCEILFEDFLEEIEYTQEGCSFTFQLPSIPQTGNIIFTVSNGFCERQVDYSVIVSPVPIASAETVPASVEDDGIQTLEVCKNQTVLFDGSFELPPIIQDEGSTAPGPSGENSCNSYSPKWTITLDGDLVNQTPLNEVYYTFNEAGTYHVSYLVQSISGCLSNVVEFEVKVVDGEVPSVECISTICATNQDTYFTDAACDVTWSVEGGIILGPNDQASVDVQWTGDLGVGLLILSLDGCDNGCTTTVVNEVPIIAASIFGPSQLQCTGEQNYSLRNIADNSDVTWELIPNDVPGISLEFNNFGNPKVAYADEVPLQSVILRATVTSLFHQCTQVVEKEITLFNADELSISGPDEICLGTTFELELEGVEPSEYSKLNYSILKNGLEVLSNQDVVSPLNLDTETFANEADDYLLLISNNDPNNPGICGSESFSFEVVDPNKPVIFTEGAFTFCGPGVIDYFIQPEDGLTPYWTLDGGETPDGMQTGTGFSFEVSWFAEGSLTVQWIANLDNCLGDTEVFEVTQESILVDIQGDQSVCANSSSIYSFNGVGLGEWSLSIPSAGSITTDPLQETIEIYWNNTSEILNVDLVLSATLCLGNTGQFVYPISVEPTPIPEIVGENEVCSSDLLSLESSLNADTYTWYLDGEVLSNESSQVLQIDPDLLGLELGLHMVRLTLENPLGCIGQTEAFHEFYINPSPFAALTTPIANCPACQTENEYLLVASEQPSNDLEHTYRWTRDFEELDAYDDLRVVPIVGGAEVHGTYRVLVTNTANCTTTSNPIELSCSNGPGLMSGENTITWGLTNIPGEVRFVGMTNGVLIEDKDGIIEVGTCGNDVQSIDLTAITSCQYDWTILDPTSGPIAYGFGPNEEFNHLFENPGYYQVGFRSICPGPEENTWIIGFGSETVVVPYIIGQTIDIECAEEGGLLQLTDNTDYLPDFADATVAWDIGEGTYIEMGSPASRFLNSGPWDIEMSITHPEVSGLFWPGFGPSYELNEFIKIGLLEGEILASAQSCEEVGVPLSLLTEDTFFNLTWSFDDGTVFLGNELSKTFSFQEDFPTRTVQLSALDGNGCEYQFSHSLEVIQNILNPQIIGEPNECPNQPYLLFANEISGENVTYVWSTGQQTPSIVASEGEFSVQVTNGSGCKANSELFLVQSELATNVILSAGGFPNCAGQSAEFEVSNIEGATYNWSINGQFINENSNELTQGLSAGENLVNVQVTYPNLCGTEDFELLIIADDIDESPVVEVSINCETSETTLEVVNYEDGEITWSTDGSTDVILPNLFEGRYSVFTMGECPSREEITIGRWTDETSLLFGCYDFCSSSFDDQSIFLPVESNTNFSSWQLINADTGELACETCEGSGRIEEDDIQLSSDWASGDYVLEVVLQNGCSQTTEPMYIGISDLDIIEMDEPSCENQNPNGSYTLNGIIRSSYLPEEVTITSNTGAVTLNSVMQESPDQQSISFDYFPSTGTLIHCINAIGENDVISCLDQRCFELPTCCFDGTVSISDAECLGDSQFSFNLIVQNNEGYQNFNIEIIGDDAQFEVLTVNNQSFPSPNGLGSGENILEVTANYLGDCASNVGAVVMLHLVQSNCDVALPYEFECCQTLCNDAYVDVDCSQIDFGTVTLTAVLDSELPTDAYVFYEWSLDGQVIGTSNSIVVQDGEQSEYNVDITIVSNGSECSTSVQGIVDCIPCENVSHPGFICCDETICAGESTTVAFITNPSGGLGEITIMWRVTHPVLGNLFYEVNNQEFQFPTNFDPGVYFVAGCVAAEGCTFVETEAVEIVVEECNSCSPLIEVVTSCSGPNSTLTAYINGELATTEQINYWQVSDMLFGPQNPITIQNEAGSSYTLAVEFVDNDSFCTSQLSGVIECEEVVCEEEPIACGQLLNGEAVIAVEQNGYTYIGSSLTAGETIMVKLYEECILCSGEVTSTALVLYSETGMVEVDMTLDDLIYGSVEIYALGENKCELIAASCFIDLENKKSMHSTISEEQFVLFPNPITESVSFVRYTGNKWQGVGAKTEVLSTKGEVVLSLTHQVEGTMRLEMGGLTSGVYFVRMVSETGAVLIIERVTVLK